MPSLLSLSLSFLHHVFFFQIVSILHVFFFSILCLIFILLRPSYLLTLSELQGALWSDDCFQESSDLYFQANGFGSFILDRKGTISAVYAGRDKQLAIHSNSSTSVYLQGCRGSGKTSSLHLLARDMKGKGWEVYFYRSSSAIPFQAGDKFLAYAKKNPNKKIAVIIDEANSMSNHDIFITLLKEAPANILTIGAAVAEFKSSNTALFGTVLNSEYLVLKEGDEDMLKLLDLWKNHPVVVSNEVTSAMVEHVSSFLLKYCGGHVYPVLAFMEHFFVNTTQEQAKEFLSSKKAFAKHFHSSSFPLSDVSETIRHRCFQNLKDSEFSGALTRVIRGKPEGTDIIALIRVGWYVSEKKSILSTLLANEHMRLIAPARLEEIVFLEDNDGRQHNLEVLIKTGLQKMSEIQPIGPDGKWPIENALSYDWATEATKFVGNVHLEFQASAGRGWVDFYVNGRIDTGLEVIRNATQTAQEGSKGGSADIDDHLERFTSGKYFFNHFALLNFALENKKLVLPRDKTHHDKVYTYHLASNALYRGSECIQPNAVRMIASPMPRPLAGEGKHRANYSTLAPRLARAASAAPGLNLLSFPTVALPPRA